MSFKQNTQFNRGRKATKRVLIGETREEEAARLEKEIAAHPVTKCEAGRSNPFLATRLEQQAAHSSFRTDSRRGDRKEDNAEGLNERLGYSAANEILMVT